jgi:hypothetical protein
MPVPPYFDEKRYSYHVLTPATPSASTSWGEDGLQHTTVRRVL